MAADLRFWIARELVLLGEQVVILVVAIAIFGLIFWRRSKSA